jgi:Domain of unknown function (DUF4129)
VQPPAPSRALRLAITAGALVALLGVVAISSRSGFGHAVESAPGNNEVDYLFTIFVIVFVAMIPVAMYGWLMRMQEYGTIAKPSGLIRALRVLILIGTASFVVWTIRDHHLGFFHHTTTTKHGVHDKVPTLLDPSRRGQKPTFEWPLLWTVLALIALAVGLGIARARHDRRERELLGPAPDEAIAASISDAIDDLEREPDPRRAVVAAYARMEGVLARHGVPRRPSEAPLEYLRRALLELGAGGAAVERLTDLFEQAKFSVHPIDDGMKRRAIAALASIRDGLTA